MRHIEDKFKCIVVFSLCFLIFFPSPKSLFGSDKKPAEYRKIQKFTHSSTLLTVTEEGNEPDLLAMEFEGEIHWSEKDDNGWKFDVKVMKFKMETEDANLISWLEKTQFTPFTARVTVSKEDDPPLSVEITEGKINNKEDKYGLGRQYETIFRISEMMLATMDEKEFLVSDRGRKTTLKIVHPKQIRIREFGVRSARSRGLSISPDEFIVFPNLLGGVTKGSELFSFSHSERTISYYYRLLDKETGFASRAVDLEAEMLEEKDKKNYTKIIEIINDPSKFSYYYLYELQMSSISQPVKITIESNQKEQHQEEQPTEVSSTIATSIKYAVAAGAIGIVILCLVIFLMKKTGISSK